MTKKIYGLFGFVLLTTAFYGQQNTSVDAQSLQLYPLKSVVSRYHNNWTQNHYAERIKVFEDAPLDFDEIVFVGNSITEQGGDWSKSLTWLISVTVV